MLKARKVLLGSMAAYLACVGFGLSTAGAATLEEAIKGVEVNGYMRYRYTSDRFDNQAYVEDNGHNIGKTTHSFRTNANLSTQVVDALKVNLGLVYNNSNTAANSSTNPPMQGVGLGASEDGKFGVSTFYATLAPSSTKTQVNAGKMRVNSPLHDTLDDRVTGIALSNQDIPGVSFSLGFFDTWMLDDGASGATLAGAPLTGDSFTKPYYTAAVGLDMQGLHAMALYAGVKDLYNYVLYFNAGFKTDIFHVKAEYAMAQLDETGFNALVGPAAANSLVKDHGLMTLEAGINFSPVKAKVGYIGSAGDGFRVSFDNQGDFSGAGKLWNDWFGANGPTQISYSALNGYPLNPESLSVLYGSIGLSFLQNNALTVAVDYVNGTKENTSNSQKITFQEITPSISYQYNPKWNFLFFYAMLSAKQDPVIGNNPKYADAIHDRYRFQAIYSF